MPALAITPVYAALVALLFLALSVRVIAYRRAHGLSLGDAGNRALLRRTRAQGNCAEYAPIGLLLLVLLELQGVAGWAIHGLGAALLAGRAAHAWGFSARPSVPALRVAGTALTLTVIAVGALSLLALALV